MWIRRLLPLVMLIVAGSLVAAPPASAGVPDCEDGFFCGYSAGPLRRLVVKTDFVGVTSVPAGGAVFVDNETSRVVRVVKRRPLLPPITVFVVFPGEELYLPEPASTFEVS
jgi:hypothetical protein